MIPFKSLGLRNVGGFLQRCFSTTNLSNRQQFSLVCRSSSGSANCRLEVLLQREYSPQTSSCLPFFARSPLPAFSERLNHEAILYLVGRVGCCCGRVAAIYRRRFVLPSSIQLLPACLLRARTGLLCPDSSVLCSSANQLSAASYLRAEANVFAQATRLCVSVLPGSSTMLCLGTSALLWQCSICVWHGIRRTTLVLERPWKRPNSSERPDTCGPPACLLPRCVPDESRSFERNLARTPSPSTDSKKPDSQIEARFFFVCRSDHIRRSIASGSVLCCNPVRRDCNRVVHMGSLCTLPRQVFKHHYSDQRIRRPWKPNCVTNAKN